MWRSVQGFTKTRLPVAQQANVWKNWPKPCFTVKTVGSRVQIHTLTLKQHNKDICLGP